MIKNVFEREKRIDKKNNSSLSDLEKAVNVVNSRCLKGLNDDDEVVIMFAHSRNCQTHAVKPTYFGYKICPISTI